VPFDEFPFDVGPVSRNVGICWAFKLGRAYYSFSAYRSSSQSELSIFCSKKKKNEEEAKSFFFKKRSKGGEE
jgi:hypothetical protein